MIVVGISGTPASTGTVAELSTLPLILPPGGPILATYQTNHFNSLMRKIESLMNAAITDSRDWRSANTEVRNSDGISYVYLHGNLIAEVDNDGIKLYDGGWQSNTTKSRLNAILSEHGIAGEGVFQKNFQWFIRLYNGTEFFTTKFTSGMRLGALTTADLLV